MACAVGAQPPPRTSLASHADEASRLQSPFPARTIRRGSLEITVGALRIVMRGPMFPTLARYPDGSVILTGPAAAEGGPCTAIRSADSGATWRPYLPAFTDGPPRDFQHCASEAALGANTNTICLRAGRALGHSIYTQPRPDKPGEYATTRWESDDNWKTVRGPLIGTLSLPVSRFDATQPQRFDGNMVELDHGEVLAAMVGLHKTRAGVAAFRSFLARSTDRGATWTFYAMVSDLDSIDDPAGRTRQGWALHGPCEPFVIRLGARRLACIMRLVNDDRNPLLARPKSTYRDLSYTDPGEGVPPGGTHVEANKYYTPGPPSVPLIISYSADNGRTWTRAKPMQEARGCFPRMAQSRGVLALTYGGLAYPRWGNCITFSLDGGRSWTPEINFAPFFTTGYTDLVAIGPGRFLCAFDCTPPQPLYAHAAHWIGVSDIAVRRIERTK